MKQNHWFAGLLFCCLILASLIYPVVGRPGRSTISSYNKRRRRRKQRSEEASFCLHRVPNADTKYVPVLNPGVPSVERQVNRVHVIDVLLIYTKAARVLRGGKSMTLLADAAAMISHTNAMYKASKIPARLNLVYATEASQDYLEANTILEDLNRLTAGDDGHLDEVHQLRQCVGADLVILLTSPPPPAPQQNVLGAAWFRTNSPAFDGTAFAPFAFAVIRYDSGEGGDDSNLINRTAQTFAHEIGHLAGCLHDVEAHTSGELSLMRKPYALGYSFQANQDAVQYRSIMSSAAAAKRIDFHSNPQIQYRGTALGNVSHANAALFLSHEFPFLEAFVAGPSPEFCSPDLVGCDGKSLSGLRVDRCGICGGTDACVDCDDVANGNKQEDCLGICGGSAVVDCLDVCNGDARIDCSDVCNGGHIEDCAMVCGGLAVEDCHLDCHGTAFIDDCGVCASGKTDKIPNQDKDCLGVCGGSAEFDECDKCDGDGSSCAGMCNCPMPPDWWKTHNCFAPVPSRRESWPGVYKDCGKLFRCETGFGLLRWLDVLHAPVDRANVWLTLAKHWITARLNLADAPCLAEVDSASRKELTEAMDAAQILLETTSNQKSCEAGQISVLSGNSADGLSALALTAVIGRFNERVEFTDSICQRTAMPDIKPERCDVGCTRIAEYWSTHHSQAEAPSLRKPWPEHTETQRFCHGDGGDSGPQKLEIMLIPKKQADAWTILAQQVIVTELNTGSDACVPKEVADAIIFSRSVLGIQCSEEEEEEGHRLDQDLKKDMLGLASILEAYNQGELGPGECGTLTLVSTDPWVIAATSACEIGCVHSGGYWATHHIDAKREELKTPWPMVDKNMDSDAPATETTILCRRQPTEISWLSLMTVSTGYPGPINAAVWLSLAQEWIAARLNTYSGACTTQPVLNALLLGSQILEINCENKLAKDKGGLDAALEIMHVLREYNDGCGSRGPATCLAEVTEMKLLLMDGLFDSSRLARHEEECMEFTESECKKEKDLSDKYLTWAVIVTLLLAVSVAVLLLIIIWWWWQVRKAERRLAQRQSTHTTPATNPPTPNLQSQYGSVNSPIYGSQATHRNTTNHTKSPWP